ncbi:MAG: hypothetical protein OHK0037_15620 [Elainellaceae cyanobacterium]
MGGAAVEPRTGLLTAPGEAIAGLGSTGLAVGLTVVVFRIESGFTASDVERVMDGLSSDRSAGAIAADPGRFALESVWLGDLSASGMLLGETSGSSRVRGVPDGNRRAPSTGRLSMSI